MLWSNLSVYSLKLFWFFITSNLILKEKYFFSPNLQTFPRQNISLEMTINYFNYFILKFVVSRLKDVNSIAKTMGLESGEDVLFTWLEHFTSIKFGRLN